MTFEELDLGRNPYIVSVHETGDDCLIVDVCAGIVEQISKEERERRLSTAADLVERLLASANKILMDENTIWRIVFENYVAFQVLNESYDMGPEGPVYEDKKFRVFDRSLYLDHVRRATLANDLAEVYSNGRPLRHYGIWSLNHIIDIISCYEPKISLIRKERP